MPDVSYLGHSPEPAATEPSPGNVKTASHRPRPGCRGREAPGCPLYAPRWHTGPAAVRPGQNSLNDNHWGHLNPQLGPGADGCPSRSCRQRTQLPHTNHPRPLRYIPRLGRGLCWDRGPRCPLPGHGPQQPTRPWARRDEGNDRGRCGPRPSHLFT